MVGQAVMMVVLMDSLYVRDLMELLAAILYVVDLNDPDPAA